MKKSKIVIFVIVGGALGLGVHLAWRSFTGVNLFSSGPHIIQGIIYILAGGILGGALHLIIPKR